MLIYLLIIFSSYFLFMLLLIIGWIKATREQRGNQPVDLVSVIVAARNEESTLPTLMESLAHQSYPYEKFEIIFVDDHSVDRTSAVISQCSEQYPKLKIIKIFSTGVGKKRAITEGVNAAQGELILTTDADCTVPPGWIEGVVSSFGESTQLAIGAVTIKTDQTFFSRVQAMEFSSVMGSGVALLGWSLATMCNGANLAFRKSAFVEVQGYEGNFEIPSGDDEFLMRKIDERYVNSIAFVSKKDCVVETIPLSSLNDFVHQRLRWAGKWKVNNSLFARTLAVFILLVQVSWLILLGVTPFNFESLFILILLKIGLEFIFLLMVSNYLKQPFQMMAFILLQIMYPVYVLLVGIASQFSTYTWKGRNGQ